MQTQTTIRLDLSQRSTLALTVGKQYDSKSRLLHIRVTDRGQPVQVGIDTVATANFTRADGETKAFLCTVESDSSLTVPLPAWLLELPGEGACEICLVGADDSRITSFPCKVAVNKSFYVGEDYPANDNYGILVDLLEKVGGYQVAETKRVASETTRQAAEAERQTNAASAIQNANDAASDAKDAAQEVRDVVEKVCIDHVIENTDISVYSGTFVSVENGKISTVANSWTDSYERLLLTSGESWSFKILADGDVWVIVRKSDDYVIGIDLTILAPVRKFTKSSNQSTGIYCSAFTAASIGDTVKVENTGDLTSVTINGNLSYSYDFSSLSGFDNAAGILLTSGYKSGVALVGDAVLSVKSNFFDYQQRINAQTAQNISDINEQLESISVGGTVANQVDLFMFMGQSNMAGRGITNTDHPEIAPTIIDGAGYEFRAISDPTKLYNIAEPFGVNENLLGKIDDTQGDAAHTPEKTGSMVTAFVNAYYSSTKVPIVGVSASDGRTKVLDWSPDYARLHDAMQRLDDCVTYLTHSNYTIRHKYMLWCQGESDGDAGTEKEVYKTRLKSTYNAMVAHGIEKCFVVRIGQYNGTDNPDRYTPIMEAQTELAKESSDFIMVSTDLYSMKDRGMMKNLYCYYQDAYNEVGTYAGVNTAYYILNRKEPTMYDPKTDDLYFSKIN